MDTDKIIPVLDKLRYACKGLVFKCKVSTYWDPKRRVIGYREVFRLLKRKSCSCPECEYLWELISCIGIEEAVILPPEPRNGQLYTAIYSGNEDGVYYEMHIYEEATK